MSAESGLKTFRDAQGLWEGHNVMEVASPEGFRNNPELVLEFYNQRRQQLLKVQPNIAHKALVELERSYKVHIITQNVDDLHERAGSANTLHLHGELLKVRCTHYEDTVLEWNKDLILGDLSEHGYQLRPHIVWFGEEVPLLMKAAQLTNEADIILIIGTSMQVYPAASLINYAKKEMPIYFIDPRPNLDNISIPNIQVIPKPATIGVPTLVASLIDKAV